jgi:hypothetical protein
MFWRALTLDAFDLEKHLGVLLGFDSTLVNREHLNIVSDSSEDGLMGRLEALFGYAL